MTTFASADLKALLEPRDGWHLSLYQPAAPPGESGQDPIRFKNLLRGAEEDLLGVGMRSPEVSAFLRPAGALLDDVAFWTPQAGGLAVFLAPGFVRTLRLPLVFRDLAVAGRRFHIKPLLPMLMEEGHFYLLALSQNTLRFFRGSRHGLEAVDVPDAPHSLAEALKYDDPERQVQFQPVAPRGAGERPAMFHGHGAAVEEAKDNILRYFQQVDAGLRPVLGAERAPLVLAGVEYLLSIYRSANAYRHLLPDAVTGSPDGLSERALWERAWPIVQDVLRRPAAEAAASYRSLAGTGLAADDLAEVVLAAGDGRVGVLFTAIDQERWGVVDRAGRRIELRPSARPGDEELLDAAAVDTLRHGGRVYAVSTPELPGGAASGMAAIFRY